MQKHIFQKNSDNLMSSEGDLLKARSNFLIKNPSNLLLFLINKRHGWINEYIEGKKEFYELGCRAGFSKYFIFNKNLYLIDVSKKKWFDKNIDTLNLPFEDNSVVVFI